MARKSDDRLSQQGAQPSRNAAEAAGPAQGATQSAQSVRARQGRDAGRMLRVLALIAVAVGLSGLTAAACVLSYSSMHHLAIQAGVYGRMASVYPLIFDAMLVVAGCSVLALRGAGLVSRVYSWLCMLVLLTALAAGGTIRATAVAVPHKPAAVVAAIVPWVLVLIGFGLLLALLRYARLRRLGKRNGQAAAAGRSGPALAPTVVGPPVSEREREGQVEQRPLIPGLPLARQTTAVPESGAARTTTAGAAGAPATVSGGSAPRPAATDLAADPAPASRDVAVERTVDAAQTAKTTWPASTLQGVEPPTVPGAAARSAIPGGAAAWQARQAGQTEHAEHAGHAGQAEHAEQAEQAGQAEQAEHAGQGESEAAAGDESASAAQASQLRPGVRRADLQLRARIPRQPAHEQTEANPVPPGWPAPFMPRVGQHGAPAEQAAAAQQAGAAGQAGAGQEATVQPADAAQQADAARQTGAAEPAPAGSGSQPGPPDEREDAGQPAQQQPGETTVAALPKRVPGQQPVTSGFEPAAAPPASGASGVREEAATTKPKAEAEAEAEAGRGDQVPDAVSPGDAATQPPAASTLNPAPTATEDDEGSGGLPTFRRTRSSPTPPQGDEDPG